MSLEISKGQLEKLIKAAAEGSVEDFRELYEIYSTPVYKFVLGMVGIEAAAHGGAELSGVGVPGAAAKHPAVLR